MKIEVAQADNDLARKLCAAADVWPGTDGIEAMAKELAAHRTRTDAQVAAMVEANALLRACLTSRTLATGDLKGVVCAPLRADIEKHLAAAAAHLQEPT